jgi:hypothetical protein
VVVESNPLGATTQVIGLSLKPELIQLSEEGERKLADAMMRDWACDQERYEKELQAQVEERRLRNTEPKPDPPQTNGSEDPAAQGNQEIAIPYIVAPRIEDRGITIQMLWGTTGWTCPGLPPETTEEDLNQLATKFLNQEACLKDKFTPIERNKQYWIWTKKEMEQHVAEIQAQERAIRLKKEIENDRRRIKEEEARAKEEAKAERQRIAEAKAQQEWLEAQAREEEERRLRLEQRVREEEKQKLERAEREPRVIGSWGKILKHQAERQEERRTQTAAKFRTNARQIKLGVQESVQKWRNQFCWRHEEGKAVHDWPGIPTSKAEDEDLREWWKRLWDQERARTQEKEIEIQEYHNSLAMQEEEQRKRQRPENRTLEEIWDEILELTELIRQNKWAKKEQSRRELLRSEISFRKSRNEFKPFDSTLGTEQKLQEINEWLQKFDRCEEKDKEWHLKQKENLEEALICKQAQEAREKEAQQRKAQEEREAEERHQIEIRKKEERRQAEIQKEEERRQKAAEDHARREAIWKSWIEKVPKKNIQDRLQAIREVRKAVRYCRWGITWEHYKGEAQRKTPPLPNPKGEKEWWDELWEQEIERYREEDEKEWAWRKKRAKWEWECAEEMKRQEAEQRRWRKEEAVMEEAKEWWQMWQAKLGPHPIEKTVRLDERIRYIQQLLTEFDTFGSPDAERFKKELREELLRGERRKEEETAMKAREEEESRRGQNTEG